MYMCIRRCIHIYIYICTGNISFSHVHTNISLVICGADSCLPVASARTSYIREAQFETFW